MVKLNTVVNLSKLINKAYNEKYALLHVNVANLEWAKAILEVANETNSPIIVAVTEKSVKYMGGYKTFANIVDNLIQDLNITIPVVLHLDHGSYDAVKAAIDVGFTSVMFDGSKLPFAENYVKTTELLKIAKKANVSFEAEVGIIGGKEDCKNMGDGELASIEQCIAFSKTSIDCLAAGIGNIHGVYPNNWKGLNFKRLKCIGEATNKLPLVLHGGSGIPERQIKEAIALGIAKLNINTDCLLAFSQTLIDFYKKNIDKNKISGWFDIRISFNEPIKAIKEVIFNKLTLSGSINKA